jgi:hypothetical protein
MYFIENKYSTFLSVGGEMADKRAWNNFQVSISSKFYGRLFCMHGFSLIQWFLTFFAS